MLRAHRARVMPAAIALTLTYAYFVGQPSWNQNSRLALTRAMVERGTTAIDPDHVTTGDKSYRDGHFYCDKAPGASWFAALPYGVFVAVRAATGGERPQVRVRPLDPSQPVPDLEQRQAGDVLVYNLAHRVALYLCGLFTAVLPGVAAAAAMFLLALRQAGGHARTAVFVALAFALATPAFPYATALYGHGLCGALLLWAFALVVLPDRGALNPRAAALAGTLLGAAVTTEYPAAVPTLVVLALAGWRHGVRSAVWVAAGGLPWALALAAYHTAAFGHPLRTGYDFVYREEFAEGMRDNYGIGLPSGSALVALLFGSYRGLLYLSPVLIGAMWGLGYSLLRPAATDLPRRCTLAAVAIVVFYLGLNAGYYMWDGGASFGPRHLVPMLGLLALGLVPAAREIPGALAVLAAVGALHMLLGAAASPEAIQFGNPVWEYAWPRALGAEAAVPGRATNLGLLLGLPGLLSLVPLVALWAWAGPLALRTDPTAPSPPADLPSAETASEPR